ncbi:hypothetical protein BD769DRAFT_1439146, partial [Suillus cothurnatus]
MAKMRKMPSGGSCRRSWLGQVISTPLDWVGQPSEFNSCLPAHISSYAAPPRALPYLSEDQIQTVVSSLRHTAAV